MAASPRPTLLPHTAMGWVAVALVVVAPFLVLVPNMVWGAGPPHTGSMLSSLLGFAAAVAAAILAIVGLVRRTERSLLVIVGGLGLGLFVLVFALGEVFFEGRG